MKKSIFCLLVIALAVGISPLVRADGTNAANISTNAPAKVVKPYPLKVCVVSGEKLGEMGDPVVLIYGDQQMKFCCNDCVVKFKKNPDKYLKKLEQEKNKKA